MRKTFTILIFIMLTLVYLLDASLVHSESGTLTTFGDNTLSKIISFPNGGGIDNSAYISISKKANIIDAYFNVSTVYDPSDIFTNNPQIDVGGDGDIEWAYEGFGYGDFGRQNKFSDDMPGQSINFDENKTFENQVKIFLPKNAFVSYATMNARGGGAGKVLIIKDGADIYGLSLIISALTKIGNSVTLRPENNLPTNWSDPKEFKAIFWIGGTSSANGVLVTLLNPIINYIKGGGNFFASGSWIDYTGIYSGTYEIPFFEWALHHTWGNRWNGGGSGIGTCNKYTHQYNTSHPVFNKPHILPTYWNNLYTGTFWHSPSGTINNGSVIGRVDTTTTSPRYNAIIAWDGPFYNPNYGKTLMVRQPIDRSWYNITQGDVLSNFTENVGTWFLGQGSVENVTIDIGDNGGPPEFDHSGKLDDIEIVPNFATELNSLLSTLPIAFMDDYGIEFVEVPVNLSCDGNGTLIITDLDIRYNLTTKAFLNPHNANLINELNELIPDTGEGNISIPLEINSEAEGKINISDIYIDYIIPDLTNDELLLLNGHGVERICYTDYEYYTFMVNITNKAGIDDVNNVTMILDAKGEQIKILWTRDPESFIELSDPKNLVTLDALNCFSNIIDPMRWNLLFSIRINWGYENETLELCALNTTNNSGAYAFNYFEDVYRVENDLEFFGNLEVTSQYQGTLIDDGINNWVRAAELITWKNLTVVYEGTINIYPLDKNFNVTISDDDMDNWINDSSSGQSFSITTISDPFSDYTDIHSIDITDIPGAGEDVTNLKFTIKTDNDGPFAPPFIICHADSPSDPETVADNDNMVYVVWSTASDGTGAGVKEYAMEYNNPLPNNIKTSGDSAIGSEGVAMFYVRARDRVGNWGTSGSASIIIDLTELSFNAPMPNADDWQTSTSVVCGITIKDLGGSGVLANSIQYRFVDKGSIEAGSWRSYHGAADAESIVCNQNINFSNDGENKKVQWRAKDLAGNGFVYSGIYNLKIDSTPVSFQDFSIDFDKWHNTLSPEISFYVNDTIPLNDKCSKVDNNSIKYQLSTNGVDNYGFWKSITPFGLGESVRCTIKPTLLEGDQNYIKLTAKDFAGNQITTIDYNIKIDITNPEFSNPIPDNLTWINSTWVQCNITIADEFSKVDVTSVRYSISINGINNYGKWYLVNLRFLSNLEYYIITLNCTEQYAEGEENYIRWKATDCAGNSFISKDYQILIDITGCSFNDPIPTSHTWVNTLMVECGIIINDTSGSGVDINSIEYTTSVDGPDNLKEWKNKSMKITDLMIDQNIKPPHISPFIQVRVLIRDFQEGIENYIYWRAKDVANNDLITGGPFKIRIDLSPLEFLNPKPKPETMQYENDLQCQITIKDVGGSGVDPNSVEFRYRTNNDESYTPWNRSGISPLPKTDSFIFFVFINFEHGDSNFIQWCAKDLAGNGPFQSQQYKIIINSPPIPKITYPKTNGDYYEKMNITFNAEKTTDPDLGDNLTFYWESNISGPIGFSSYFKSIIPPGLHNISLYVSDKHNHNVSCHVNIIVKRTDMDKDGVPDIYDPDLDGDGYANLEDVFPSNKKEWLDSDFDGIGNNADPDDDNDGYSDSDDAYPLDDTRWEGDVKEEKSSFNLLIIIIIFIVITFLIIYLVIKHRKAKVQADKNAEENKNKTELCYGMVTPPATVTPGGLISGTGIGQTYGFQTYMPGFAQGYAAGFMYYQKTMQIQMLRSNTPQLPPYIPPQVPTVPVRPLQVVPLQANGIPIATPRRITPVQPKSDS